MELVSAGAMGLSGGTPRFLCLGEGMIELSGPPGEGMRLSYAGDAMNLAVYLARLGCDVAFATAVGCDPYSEELLTRLGDERVNTRFIRRDTARLPGLYVIRTRPDGERDFHYWRSDSAARALFQSADVEGFLAAVEPYADIVALTGITLSLLTMDGVAATAAMLERVRARGGEVAFDINYRPRGWESPAAAAEAVALISPYVTIALPTLEDEAALYGIEAPAEVAARWLKAGAREAVVKCGARGAYFASADENDWVRPDARLEPIDTTGAGDSFNAAYLASRLHGRKPISVAATQGGRLAGVVIMHRGAIVPPAAMREAGLC